MDYPALIQLNRRLKKILKDEQTILYDKHVMSLPHDLSLNNTLSDNNLLN
jgi:hypothetical protein